MLRRAEGKRKGRGFYIYVDLFDKLKEKCSVLEIFKE